MPHCTAAVDAVRAVFGEGVKVLWLSENGKELGKRPKPDAWAMSADAYIALADHYKHLVWGKRK